MESIDKIGQHEKFLAKNFESLDVEDDPNEGTGESPNGKNRYCQPCWYLRFAVVTIKLANVPKVVCLFPRDLSGVKLISLSWCDLALTLLYGNVYQLFMCYANFLISTPVFRVLS